MDEHLKKHWELEGVIFNEGTINFREAKEYHKIFEYLIIFTTQIAGLKYNAHFKNSFEEDIHVIAKKWKEEIILKILCIFLNLEQEKYLKPENDFLDFMTSDEKLPHIEITSVLENRVHKYISDYNITEWVRGNSSNWYYDMVKKNTKNNSKNVQLCCDFISSLEKKIKKLEKKKKQKPEVFLKKNIIALTIEPFIDMGVFDCSLNENNKTIKNERFSWLINGQEDPFFSWYNLPSMIEFMKKVIEIHFQKKLENLNLEVIICFRRCLTFEVYNLYPTYKKYTLK